MSAGLLAAIGIAYLYVAWGYFRAGKHGLAIAFLAYAIANLGFIVDLTRGK